ncbi:eukaryotic translation initiation factor 4B3-like [Salvia splendens]|uniref:eukaryotic translation initiation factor 4B3-like n=1 Tax=Salvia splendens TaxID=180675 RepID=UPI001C27F4CC|nr:eukaryotic translation initiation factor 4B3-like [Salvia splendens]
MAATVKTAWAKPGAWALDAEENESELLQQQEETVAASNGHSETADFPSLAAAKTKKKKKQVLSLQEFSTYSPAKPAAFQAMGLTTDELMALPTGPRERTAEELDRNKLGGGFRSYGGGMRDEQPRRQGSFNRESNRELAPSRADETDNWAAGKRSSAGSGFERRERGERGGFFTDSQSRADEVDNWGSNKSFAPSEPRKYERRGGFGLESSNGGADSGSWMKRREEEGPRMGGAFDSLRERRGVSDSADSESWGRRREEVSAGSRPRLNLQPRTLPVIEITAPEKPKAEIASPVAVTVRPAGSNPFGQARPREEVLKEKGQDWKEIEEKLESTKIKEVVSDGPDPPRKNFWSGRERRQEEKTERAWRKPESADSRPQRAEEAVNGHTDKFENGHTEEAEGGEAQG